MLSALATAPPVTYELDHDQYGSVMICLSLLVLLLAVHVVGSWRK